jgi:hypothetical protein
MLRGLYPWILAGRRSIMARSQRCRRVGGAATARPVALTLGASRCNLAVTDTAPGPPRRGVNKRR